MSYSFNFNEIIPTNISISIGKEAQMPDPKGGQITYKTGELEYLVNGSRNKLIVKGPVCETKSGIYMSKEDEAQPMPQAYHQPNIGGYGGQAMFNPSSMAPQKKAFKKKISGSIPFQLEPNNEKTKEHNTFITILNEINKVVNERMYDVRHSIYAGDAIIGQKITNKPLVSYRVDDITHEIDTLANPTVWCQVKKYEDQLNKVFMMPNKTYACYKDLIGTPFSGIPIFSFTCFFGKQAKTCKLNMEGFIVKEIKTSVISNDMILMVDQMNSEDPELAERVLESYNKILSNKSTPSSCTTETLDATPPTVTDLSVMMPPPTVTNPQTYQVPQTPIQQGVPHSYQIPHTYQQQYQQPPAQSFLYK